MLSDWLKELSDRDLYAELERRMIARYKGTCDYCGQKPVLSMCEHSDRHYAAQAKPIVTDPQTGGNVNILYRLWIAENWRRLPEIVKRTKNATRGDAILQQEFRALLINCKQWEVYSPLSPTASTFYTDGEILEMHENDNQH